MTKFLSRQRIPIIEGFRLNQRIKNFGRACLNMGFTNTLGYIVKGKILKYAYGTILKAGSYRVGVLSTNQLKFPVCFRYNSSDINVFSQIFVTDEYGPLHSLQDVRFIIDCGAYIGFSSAYLLSRFPEATLIAIEPDKQNYELLKQNLRPYGDRAKTLNAAVWPSNAGVKVSASGVGAEAEWATTVRQCRDGEQPDVKSIDVETLLAQTGYKQIDIAKMDIEGAEELLFAHSVNGWVNKVRAFAIELHNEECRKVFYRALNSDVFTFSLSGEVTIAHRR